MTQDETHANATSEPVSPSSDQLRRVPNRTEKKVEKTFTVRGTPKYIVVPKETRTSFDGEYTFRTSDGRRYVRAPNGTIRRVKDGV